MKTGSSSGKYQIMAEINMIPFIDVSLVLLVIFMVMTPFLVRHQIKLDLPVARASDKQPERDRSVSIQVQKSGAIFLDGRVVPTENFEAALHARVPNPKEQRVMIEADKTVPFQQVILVMSTARKLGITSIGIAVVDEAGATAPGSPARRTTLPPRPPRR